MTQLTLKFAIDFPGDPDPVTLKIGDQMTLKFTITASRVRGITANYRRNCYSLVVQCDSEDVSSVLIPHHAVRFPLTSPVAHVRLDLGLAAAAESTRCVISR
jgi:hypothetical protein